jgi:hypothetical protein
MFMDFEFRSNEKEIGDMPWIDPSLLLLAFPSRTKKELLLVLVWLACLQWWREGLLSRLTIGTPLRL